MEIHDLEHWKARQDPPELLYTASFEHSSDFQISRRRQKTSNTSILEDFIEKKEDRHNELMEEKGK